MTSSSGAVLKWRLGASVNWGPVRWTSEQGVEEVKHSQVLISSCPIYIYLDYLAIRKV